MSGPRIITVGPADAGQKLTQFLSRLVGKDVPKSALMRWIRTGQVRVDGRRFGPYDRVEEGQAVRVPPFFAAGASWDAPQGAASVPDGFNGFGEITAPRSVSAGAPGLSESGAFPTGCEAAPAGPNQPKDDTARRNALIPDASGPIGPHGVGRTPGGEAGAGGTPNDSSWLPVLFETDTLLVINKPAGLPVHPGSGWTDSVQTRLSARYSGAAFTPTLVHRLDRDTSGVLLAAKAYRTLAALHEAFRSREVVKIYLAWVHGDWTLSRLEESVEMRDALAKTGPEGKEKVHTGEGKAARLEATPLCIEKGRTLLAIRLFTGRTHQIRAQLSSRCYPIVGDGKYGGGHSIRNDRSLSGGRMPMLLHAWKLSVDGRSFCAPPPWPEGWREAVPVDDRKE